MGEEPCLSQQEIRARQREYGTLWSGEGERDLTILAEDEAFLLVKLVEEQEWYLALSNSGDFTIERENRSGTRIPARFWKLRVLAAEGSLPQRSPVIWVMDMGSLVEDPAPFQLGEVFFCGVSSLPAAAEGGGAFGFYYTHSLATFRIAPGGYVFRRSPELEDSLDGLRMDLFFQAVREIRSDRIWRDYTFAVAEESPLPVG